VVVNTHQEVFVFQCVPSGGLAFDLSVNHASFQIEDVAKLLLVFELASVLHQHDVTVLNVLGVHCIHT
jgi:hypothetical protein